MPISREWLIENRVSLGRIYGEITSEDVQRANAEAAAAITAIEGSDRIHSIFDLREADMSRGSLNLNQLSSFMESFRNPKLGWMVAISSNRLANFVFSVTNGVFGTRMRIFKTPEEAIAFLQDIDSTLPPIPTFSNTTEATAD